MRRSALLTLVLPAVFAAAGAAQTPRSLTLAEALGAARDRHPGLIDARARRAVAAADASGSRAAWLPRLSIEWGLVRTDDPVAVFGSKLRQGIFAASDLALPALNQPAAVTNASTGVTLEQPLLAPQGWLGRKVALAGAEAGRRFEERAAQLTAFDVVQSYFGAWLAGERVAVMDSVLRAANRTLDQVRALRREGVVTAVDEQLALSRVSELEAGRAMADAEAVAARDHLLTLMGEAPGQPLQLVDDAAVAAVGIDPAPVKLDDRPDLAGLEAASRASRANVDRVRAQWLPSLGAFGSLAWNQGALGTLSGSRRWTAGLMVRWNLFGGLADLAALDRARAEQVAADERLAASRLEAEAEVRAASARLAAAEAAVQSAERALEHSREATRIAESRYGGGVATISELLAVRAAEASQRLGRLQALYQARIARAALQVARGGIPQ